MGIGTGTCSVYVFCSTGVYHAQHTQCILPCLVPLLPRNDPLIHCIRAYVKYRVMSSLHATSDHRLATLKLFISKYEAACKVCLLLHVLLLFLMTLQRVSNAYGKSFDFYKQHMCAHVVDDIRSTGTLNNKTTRVGEAFQQEVKAAYETTNYKANVDHQVSPRSAQSVC